jgi:hypothetical protein
LTDKAAQELEEAPVKSKEEMDLVNKEADDAKSRVLAGQEDTKKEAGSKLEEAKNALDRAGEYMVALEDLGQARSEFKRLEECSKSVLRDSLGEGNAADDAVEEAKMQLDELEDALLKLCDKHRGMRETVKKQEMEKKAIRSQEYRGTLTELARCEQTKNSVLQAVERKDGPPKLTQQDLAALVERAGLLELEHTALANDVAECWRQKVCDKEKPSFEYSETFQVYVEGYFFSMGEEGLGYYPDTQATEAGAAIARANGLESQTKAAEALTKVAKAQVEACKVEVAALDQEVEGAMWLLQNAPSGREEITGRCSCGAMDFGVKCSACKEFFCNDCHIDDQGAFYCIPCQRQAGTGTAAGQTTRADVDQLETQLQQAQGSMEDAQSDLIQCEANEAAALRKAKRATRRAKRVVEKESRAKNDEAAIAAMMVEGESAKEVVSEAKQLQATMKREYEAAMAKSRGRKEELQRLEAKAADTKIAQEAVEKRRIEQEEQEEKEQEEKEQEQKEQEEKEQEQKEQEQKEQEQEEKEQKEKEQKEKEEKEQEEKEQEEKEQEEKEQEEISAQTRERLEEERVAKIAALTAKIAAAQATATATVPSAAAMSAHQITSSPSSVAQMRRAGLEGLDTLTRERERALEAEGRDTEDQERADKLVEEELSLMESGAEYEARKAREDEENSRLVESEMENTSSVGGGILTSATYPSGLRALPTQQYSTQQHHRRSTPSR